MKKILILGSTGSIGQNALEIIRNNKNEFQIIGLTADKNIKLLKKEIDEFQVENIFITAQTDAFNLKNECKSLKSIYFGEKGLVDIVKNADYDILLTAVSGAIGISATVEAIKRNKIIALANKETMVAAGECINALLKLYKKARIIPVDSEHSAIFQSFQGFSQKDIKKIIITASGGTFRGKKTEELKEVGVEEALKHPNWSMGKKITIDSSTLVNKGLEVIEAHHLFNIDYENIEVLVHPQSIIHSMVEYNDGSIIAQMGVPDMKTPILYAFNYPKKEFNSAINFMDFRKYSELTFEEFDRSTFKGVDLAYKAGMTGGTMPAVFNAANEVAVDLFLNRKIKFLDIYRIIEEAMEEHNPILFEDRSNLKVIDEGLKIIKAVDHETRKKVKEKWGK